MPREPKTQKRVEMGTLSLNKTWYNIKSCIKFAFTTNNSRSFRTQIYQMNAYGKNVLANARSLHNCHVHRAQHAISYQTDRDGCLSKFST